jgi:hypothetical protein
VGSGHAGEQPAWDEMQRLRGDPWFVALRVLAEGRDPYEVFDVASLFRTANARIDHAQATT